MEETVERNFEIYCLDNFLRDFYVEFCKTLREGWTWSDLPLQTKRFIYPDEFTRMFVGMEEGAREDASFEGDFNIAVNMEILIEQLLGPGVIENPMDSAIGFWLNLIHKLTVCYAYDDLFSTEEIVILYRKFKGVLDGRYLTPDELGEFFKEECKDPKCGFPECLDIDTPELLRRREAGNLLDDLSGRPHLFVPLLLRMDVKRRKKIINSYAEHASI